MYFSYSPTPSPSPSRSMHSIYSISPTSPSSSSALDMCKSSCAYPSWPRRASLNDDGLALSSTTSTAPSASAEREVTSFVSDDDLFPDVFDDADSDCTPLPSPCRSMTAEDQRVLAEHVTMELWLGARRQQQQVLQQQQQQQLLQAEKRRKRRAASAGSKKSSRRGSKVLSPILEGGE